MGMLKLKNFTVYKVLTDTEEGTTYEAGRKIPGIQAMNISPVIDTKNIPGDDTILDVVTVFSHAEIGATLDEVSIEDYAYLLGKSVGTEGAVDDTANDIAPYFAVSAKAGKSNGQDRYITLYKVKFNQPEEAFKTLEGADTISQELSGTAVKRNSDEKWRVRVDSDSPTVAPETISGWFTKPFGTPVVPPVTP